MNNRLIIRPSCQKQDSLERGSLEFLDFIETENGVEVVHTSGYTSPLNLVSIELGRNTYGIKAIRKNKISSKIAKALASTDNYLIVEKEYNE